VKKMLSLKTIVNVCLNFSKKKYSNILKTIRGILIHLKKNIIRYRFFIYRCVIFNVFLALFGLRNNYYMYI